MSDPNKIIQFQFLDERYEMMITLREDGTIERWLYDPDTDTWKPTLLIP